MPLNIIIISVIYAVCAFATIAVMYKNEQNSYVLLKVLTSFLFLVIGFLAYNSTGDTTYFWLLPAFVMCFLGDLLLGLAHEIDNNLKQPQFTLGVGSFLIGHLFFCWQFLRMLDYKIGPTTVVAVITVIVAACCARSDKFDYGSNKVSAVIYSFFVGLLCGLGLELFTNIGFTGETAFLGIGSVCFLASDLLLSVKYFKVKKIASLGFFVLVTYYAAMWLFSTSILM